ncbi:MAG TPA: polyhydroxyalkanoate synthesis regulator DNA-binding domain-containing protein [Terracidiphilus sp.]|nr:polyhydroxyalkanoate synthesis regulator DNA-binding domain-containing protein [Terracidiphilus sp.]
MAAKTILIKKYENRRLYDASNSRYVNLEDVAGMVQRGDDVRVIDVATGDDITRLVLTQIIVEGAKTPESGFPLDVLRDMVMASGRASQESAIRYTKAMLDLYKSTYRAMSPAFNPFDFMPGAAAGAREAPSPAGQAQLEQPSSGKPSEVTDLRQRVAELEKLVLSLAGQKKQPKTAGRAAPRKTRKVTPKAN